jgi:drug/metabolite transporter (DMT)-like permease
MYEDRVKNINQNSMSWLIIGLIVINAFWGASGVAVKEAYGQLSTIEIVTLRFALATPLLIIATLALKGRSALVIDIKDLPLMVLLATVGISATIYTQAWSLDLTTVTNFTLISSLSTFGVMLLSMSMSGEMPTKDKVLGAVVALLGLAIIMTNGKLGFSPHIMGDGIALASAFFWALYTVLGKKIAEKYSALTVLSYVFLIASLEFLPFYLASPHTSPLAFTGLTWISICFLTVFCSTIAFLVYNHSLEKLSATTVALSLYVTPLSGVLLAAVVLGESLTEFTLLGGLLIVYGLYLAEGRGLISSRSRLND